MNVYDFDGTVYGGDSTVDFFFYALKRTPALARYIPRQAAGFVLYAMKKVDKTAMKEYFYSFLQGIDGEKLAEDFWDSQQHKIYFWYRQQQEPVDVIISASPEFLLRPICRRLAIRHLIASEVDSRTGKYTGKNCRGQEKVARMRREFGDVPIRSFYSDSISDLPLAKLADNAFLVKKGNPTAWEIH